MASRPGASNGPEPRVHSDHETTHPPPRTQLDAQTRSIVGYCAHWRESLADPDTKIIRPQQDYRGVWLRHYAPMPARATGGSAPAADAPVYAPESNAYQRRVAGENWQ